MKTNDEIRRENLNIAIARVKTAAALAEKARTSPAYLSQVKNAQPDSKTGVPKHMGDDVARRIEKAIGEPEGWIDTDHTPLDVNSMISAPKASVIEKMQRKSMDMIGNNDISPRLEIQGRLPLISWNQARNWDDLVNTFALEDAEDWLDCPVPHSSRSYCVQNVSDGMDDGTSEGYREGEILFVDPEVIAAPGDDVIVNTPDDKTIFRRLKEDTEGMYLLSLNGKKIMRIPEGANICGVVIFSGVHRKRRA